MLIKKSIKTSYSDGLERVYTYVITKQAQKNFSEYGIEIEREDMVNGKITNIVKEEVKNITSKKSEVLNILELLSRNLVSPIHMVDILCEYIDSNVY